MHQYTVQFSYLNTGLELQHWCLDAGVFSSHSSSVLCPSIFRSPPGSKAAPRPGGIGSAAAGQPGMEGEGMFSKILPGGAAEQAGKLGEGMYKCNILGGNEQKIYII